MYFSGTLAIDPSQMTVIRKIKPTKLFGKLLDALTFGRATEKEEHETFTAISILQQLNMGLRAMKIKNVVRLSVNDYDFYLDDKGLDDDMSQAMLEFETKIDPLEAEVFDKIFLVVEHDYSGMKYLVEIEIDRCHCVGQYPIHLRINGLVSDFRLRPGETKADLELRMNSIFSNQEAYYQFVKSRKEMFAQFVNDLEHSIKKYVKTDKIRKTIENKMIRPMEKIESPSQIRSVRNAEPVYHGYFGFGNVMFYSMLWAGMCHHHNIYVNDFSLMDESGNQIMDVGANGFYAGDGDALNTGADFAPPAEGDIGYTPGNEYDSYIDDSYYANYGSGGGEGGNDWLGGVDDGGDSSSCSSCSSCGGCGGCGGCT